MTLLSFYRIHDGEKPYACWICDYKSRVSTGLMYHMKSNHNESRIYSCKTCPEKFKLHSELTQHQKLH